MSAHGATVPVELRTLVPEQWDAWYATLEEAFGGVAEAPEERALWRALTETGRSLAAWDGDEVVGTAGAFSFRLSVPGGSPVPAAGVTMVGVLPTHRRRGVLRSLMRRQLDDIRARGTEPLAVLTASEPTIYGRFGYGCAVERMSLSIDTTRVSLAAPEGTDAVRLRLVPPEKAADRCEELYAERVPLRPGMVARGPGWERLPLLDPESRRDGGSPLRCVVAEEDGRFCGYALYSVKPEWEAAGPSGTVRVRDVEARSPRAYAALWRFLAGIDLTSSVVAHSRPVDDPVLHLVSDVRRCHVSVRDLLHVRPVDVGAALSARAYAAPVDVVFEVEDAFCPWNTGRWRLTGDTGGAVCAPTRDAADLALSVRELGSAYLGGVSLAALAGAGRVRELRAGALERAATAFLSPVAPWLPHGF
ncbi:GNAT family N-acetyltransferase [Streptomyces sp. NPDC059637]|uniref:GNAT family N-acetyltransferase n=1 Tax=Streptomyces sp. NPDC059637 TaxID=3347752 RepID=UPI0036BD4CD9